MNTARKFFKELSRRFGGGANPYLLSETHKSELARRGFTQRVVHLLPHRESIIYAKQLGLDTRGWRNLCHGSTRGCRMVCLSKAGRLGLTASERAAFVRSYLWQQHFDVFCELLDDEVGRFKNRCDDQPVVRTFGTHDGDVTVDIPDIVERHHDVWFNDYTKLDIPTGWILPNVYRIKSATELTTVDEFRDYAARGLNHAVPFHLGKHDPLPTTYHGIPVVDGDFDDLRFLDPDGVIVGLRYKVAHGVDVKRSHGFIRPVPVTIR